MPPDIVLPDNIKVPEPLVVEEKSPEVKDEKKEE